MEAVFHLKQSADSFKLMALCSWYLKARKTTPGFTGETFGKPEVEKDGEGEGRGKNKMSKYDALWKYVQSDGRRSFKLTFDEIAEIAGIAIDHSFLKYKKELTEYGYEVGKISMKEKTVIFNKVDA